MLKRFNWFIREYKISYIFSLLFMFAYMALDLVPPWLMGKTADLIAEGNLLMSDLYFYVGLTIGSIVIGYFLSFAYQYLMFRGTDLMGRETRRRLVKKLLRQGPIFYENNSIGSLMGKATNDVRNLQDVAGFGVMSLVMSTIYPLIIIGVMSYMVSFKMTILSVLPMILIVMFTRLAVSGLYQAHYRIQRAFDKLNEGVLENVNGVREIRAFNREDSERARFDERSEEYYQANMDQVKLAALFPAVTKLVPGISYIIAFVYGSHLISQSQLTLGALVSFTMYLNILIRPVSIFGEFVNVFQMAAASMDRIWEIWKHKEEVSDSENPKNYGGGEDLVFDDFSFSYSDSTQALKNIDVKISPGQTLGIVGKIGSGKTSFLKQILRLYPIDDRSIFLGDEPIESFSTSSIRDKIGYVPQDHILFSKSIKDNLTFGQSYSDEEIEKAIELADFKKDLDRMPKGIETMVGERGVSLSGGQKQRLSIARALLTDPEILILDDSLSAVDAKTEKNIISNLINERKGKTTLISAHRLSGIMHAEEIIVLDNGQITERGSHQELVDQEGWYYEQFQAQKLEAANE